MAVLNFIMQLLSRKTTNAPTINCNVKVFRVGAERHGATLFM
jgi:hypothetical protein